jgi:hypothetical protein
LGSTAIAPQSIKSFLSADRTFPVMPITGHWHPFFISSDVAVGPIVVVVVVVVVVIVVVVMLVMLVVVVVIVLIIVVVNTERK